MLHAKKIVFFFVLSALLYACSQDKETKSGIKIKYITKGDGVASKPGEYLLINMRFGTQIKGKDTVWTDTRKQGMPVIVQMMDSVQKNDGVMEAFKLLTRGDSVSFKVSAKQLFTYTFHRPLPPDLDSTSVFTFDCGLDSIMTLQQAQAYQQKVMERQQEKFKKEQTIQLGKDTVAVDDYLKSKNIVAQKTKSGLRYVITKKGAGNNAQAGQNVKIHYAGYLLNGKLFDTSIEAVAKANNTFDANRKYEPLALSVGSGQVIPGWEEAITLMNKGSKMTVYIPSTMAYGPNQRGPVIGPNSILVFDMDMQAIETPKK